MSFFPSKGRTGSSGISVGPLLVIRLGAGPGVKRMGGSVATLGGGTGVSGSTTGTLGGVPWVGRGAGFSGLVAGTWTVIFLIEC